MQRVRPDRGLTLLATVLRSSCHHHARPRTRLKSCLPAATPSIRVFSSSTRWYATHHDHGAGNSNLLSQALDQRQQASKGAQSDMAGPFMLGTVSRGGPAPKKWSELSMKGKVLRSTARTSDLTVIVIGASLSVLLAYAFLSEVFARNSPTVLHADACTRITQCPRVRAYMPGPLTFHNNPPTVGSRRPKHRNRHVSSQVFVDAQGREHLVLNFYVAVGPVSSGERAGLGLLGEDGGLAGAWRRVTENAWTWKELSGWARRSVQAVEDRTRTLFLYLTGENGTMTDGAKYPYATMGREKRELERRETQIGRSEGGGGVWSSVAGLFSGLGKSVAEATSSGSTSSKGEFYEEGEVHCELVKNDDGNFVWRYILIDMPNTRVHYPNRVFVERASGVPDNVAVIRWY